MTDLAILAAGFGLLPLLALALLIAPDALRRHESVVWALLAGVVAFLGLAHAGAAILEGNAFLRFEASPGISAAVAAAGLMAGIAAGWVVLGRGSPVAGLRPSALVWAAAAYIALHSFTDGLALGGAYAGPGATGFSITPANVVGTVLHRFAEGSLILAPAVLAKWRSPRVAIALLVGLVTLPAAYVPVAILAPASFSAASVAAEQALEVFGAGLEAGFAILLLLLGILPRIRPGSDARWAVWVGLGFAFMLLVHFFVE